MTNVEFREALLALGIGQGRAAKLCNVNERTVRSWASGRSPINPSAARLLRLLILIKMDGARAIALLDGD